MSEHKPVIKDWFMSGYDLYLDEVYYISFWDQKQKYSEKERAQRFAEYDAIKLWPDTPVKFKKLAGLHPEQNPNYIKITGRMLVEWSEKGFIPNFDKFFSVTRRLVMVPIEAWDFYTKNSTMLRKRKKKR